MIKKELISKLKDFNLNTYESKIWVALLMRGSATAGKLSELTDVPRSRCYDVLESLEKKGFIILILLKIVDIIKGNKIIVKRLKNICESSQNISVVSYLPLIIVWFYKINRSNKLIQIDRYYLSIL